VGPTEQAPTTPARVAPEPPAVVERVVRVTVERTVQPVVDAAQTRSDRGPAPAAAARRPLQPRTWPERPRPRRAGAAQGVEPVASPPPVVRVEIGRVDVRAIVAAPAVMRSAERERPPDPAPALEDYLRDPQGAR
jgi:hypothetical protein